MAEFLNLPTKEQFQELINVQRLLADKVMQDFTNSPGPKTLLRGDTDAGFYGFVTPEEMGVIESNPVGSQKYNGSNLALALGISSGTSFNSEVPLMKFHHKGKILFIPLTGYRHSIPWNEIYDAGAVYGSGDEGFLPPNGRCGIQLNVDSTDNSINTINGDFLEGVDSSDTVATVGDTLVLKDWSNEENNGEFTVDTITANKIIVSGGTLVTEAGGKKSKIYPKLNAVTQNAKITIGGKQYRVRLMKGAGSEPLDSYADLDRGAIGSGNEWNDLILPLHERAKLGNWEYSNYAKKADGTAIEDWGIGLTDENLRTHNEYGAGHYTWCQETRDDEQTFRRVFRGSLGASSLAASSSWFSGSFYGWRPVLESI